MICPPTGRGGSRSVVSICVEHGTQAMTILDMRGSTRANREIEAAGPIRRNSGAKKRRSTTAASDAAVSSCCHSVWQDRPKIAFLSY